MNYQLHITLKNLPTSLKLEKIALEAWDQDENNADDLLGTAKANQDGHFIIQFSAEQFNGKRESGPEVYLKVYDGDQLIYVTRDTVIYSMQQAKELEIVLVLPATPGVESLPIPIKGTQLGLKLTQLQGLSSPAQTIIKQKLNAYVKEQLARQLTDDIGPIVAALNSVVVDLDKDGERRVADVFRELVLPTLRKDEQTRGLFDEVKVSQLPGANLSLGELAKVDSAIKVHPAFVEETQTIRRQQLAFTALNDKKLATRIADKLPVSTSLANMQWQQLLEDNMVTETQKQQLQRSFSLSVLTGDNYQLVDRLFVHERIVELKDIAAWTAEDWEKELTGIDNETPNGESKEDYIQGVLRAVEQSFPTAFAVARMKVDANRLRQQIKTVGKAIQTEGFFAKKITADSAVANEKEEQFLKAQAQLRVAVNRFGYLGIQEVLSGQDSAKGKIAEIEKRVASLGKLFDNNPELQLSTGKLTAKIGSDRDHLNWEGIEDDLRPKVQRQLLAEQRVAHLAIDHASSVRLLEKGMHSAGHVAQMSYTRFQEEAGFDERTAKRIFSKAQFRHAQTQLHYQALVSLHHNQQLGLTVDNTISHKPNGFRLKSGEECGSSNPNHNSLYSEIHNDLQDIDGYEDLFGPQNFCACEDCQSIFSPAAYFVDLMRWVDEHISLYSRTNTVVQQYCENGNEKNLLYLENRRPDLWDMNITCENTHELIPYLQLVNEIKTAYIKRLWEIDQPERDWEEEPFQLFKEVYEQPVHHRFFRAPVSIAQQKLEVALEYFNTTLSEVYQVVRPNLVSCTYFGLGRMDLHPLRNPIHLYFEHSEPFNKIEVKQFLQITQVNRAQLSELLAIEGLSALAPELKITKEAFDPEIQFYHEMLEGITNDWLVACRRFLLPWYRLNCSIAEWALVVDTIYVDNSTNLFSLPFNPFRFLDLAYEFEQIRTKLGISVTEAVGGVSGIPTQSLGTVEKKNQVTGESYSVALPSLLENLFKAQETFTSEYARAIVFDNTGEPIILSGSSDPIVVETEKNEFRVEFSVLLDALELTHEEWTNILSKENPALQNGTLLIPSNYPVGEYYKINDNDFISLLYRHTLIPRQLDISQADWFQILNILKKDASDLKQILEIIEFVEEWESSPYSWELLHTLTTTNSASSWEYLAMGVEDVTTLATAYKRSTFFNSIQELAEQLGLSLNAANILLLNLADAGIVEFYDSTQHQFRVLRRLQSENYPTSLRYDFAIITTEGPGEELYEAFLLAEEIETINGTLLETHESVASEERLDVYLTQRSLIINSLNTLYEQEKERKNIFWAEVTGEQPESYSGYEYFLNSPWLNNFYTSITADFISEEEQWPLGLPEFIIEARKWSALLQPLDWPIASFHFVFHEGANYIKIDGTSFDELRSIDNLSKLLEYTKWVHLDKEQTEGILHPLLREIRRSTPTDDYLPVYQGLQHYFEFSLPSVRAFFDVFFIQVHQLGPLVSPFHYSKSSLFLANSLRDRIELGLDLGCEPEQIKSLQRAKFEDHHLFHEALIQTVRRKSESEERFDKAFTPLNNRSQELERDILCQYILSRPELHFQDANELYAYFLIDPQMGGCMQISRIVAAHLSLQLYVQRVQMNLERSFDGHFVAALNPQVQHQWPVLKNFQVWVAARKVQVYPERYIEPELQVSKTPEFEEFEESLLQSKVDDTTVEKLIKRYINRFSDISNITTANVHLRKNDADNSTYYIVGRTKSQPYVHYLRTMEVLFDPILEVEHKKFSPWEKIDLDIKADKVNLYWVNSKLILFWIENKLIPKSDVEEGNITKKDEKDFMPVLKFSKYGTNGAWGTPQELGELYENEVNDVKKFFLIKLKSQEKRLSVSRFKDRLDLFEIDGQLFGSYVFSARNSPNYVSTFNQGAAQRIFYKIDLDINEIVTTGNIFDSLDIYESSRPHMIFGLGLEGNDYRFFKRMSYDLFYSLSKEYWLGSSPYALTTPFSSKKFTPYVREVSTSIEIESDQQVDLRDYYLKDSTLIVGGTSLLYRQINAFKGHRESDNTQDYQSKRTFGEVNRLDSTIGNQFQEIIHERGLQGLFALETQQIQERELPFDITNDLNSYSEEAFNFFKNGSLNFEGLNKVYYLDIYFNIPFLIASHLNADGRYKDAQKWYHRIFNPTSPLEEGLNNQSDKNWRFLYFRSKSKPRYSEILVDSIDVRAYLDDPFNPHAIAQIRPSAYQKVIVRKYIENLLDWGDSLFRKFQFETINEAMILYVLVQNILGERPKEFSKCESTNSNSITYRELQYIIKSEDQYDDKTNFLIWLENQYVDWGTSSTTSIQTSDENILTDYSTTENSLDTTMLSSNVRRVDYPAHIHTLKSKSRRLLFCVPMDKELLSLWDRVEDRLYKLRNCMNIDGVRQQPALFAPEIDPKLLVRARAAGLSIEEAIASLDAPIPTYRFTFMLEKARAYVGIVQSFGGSLLNAIEKKDAEELVTIRSVHEQNILQLTNSIKLDQIKENRSQRKNLEEAKVNIQNRIEYYSSLIDLGLLPEEKNQQELVRRANTNEEIAGMLKLQASYIRLLAQVGSPTAMTYGGQELGESMNFGAEVLSFDANMLQRMAASAGINAGNKRREQEWKQQLKLAEQELKAIDQQIIAAEIRLVIAEKDLQIHETQIEQARELYDFYKAKFSNLGLYKYMATTLNRLYSQAYNLAFELAKKAEKCYQFETDDISFFIQNDNRDSGHAGLLAGERLSLQLIRMEKAFIEKSPRREEIRQSFSLRMLDPLAFLALRKDGSCTFRIPEEAFDIYYPGHYKRMIKSASITIPCVVGPYTNVPVRFTLLSSEIRNQAGGDLFQGPNFANGGLSASSGVNDSGQLELNFQDSKYLPFEGGGAISTWSLQLPNSVRPFDYNSISDVILQINYTAEYDATLRSQVETEIQGKIPTKFRRLISVREEFPDVWYQLEPPAGTADLVLPDNLLPYFMTGSSISKVYHVTDQFALQDITSATISLDSSHIITFTDDDGSEYKGVFLVLEGTF